MTQRHEYKATWEALADTREHAMMYVASTFDETLFTQDARDVVGRIESLVRIGPDDVVMEIGCGVGRLGQVIAPRCKRWIGTDVSGRMLGFARERLAQLANVELIETSGFDLSQVPDESVDVIYCSVVFMHLDEWDRYGYVLEARRVLRAGGRLFVDNFNLASPMGWSYFEQHRRMAPQDRPPFMSKSSTPQELRLYLEHAGFEEIMIAEPDAWVCAAGIKGAAGAEPEYDVAINPRLYEMPTDETFDEECYLAANPDVALSVRDGSMPSGRFHFESAGRAEMRRQRRRDL